MGPVRLCVGGDAIRTSSRSATALLAYLCRRVGTEVPRETLSGLLWGDRSDAQARASLRQALSALRKALGPEGSSAVKASRQAVCIDPAHVDIDVARFEAAVDAGAPEEMTEAVDLYGGDLLEGFSPIDPEFDRWLDTERAALRARLVSALDRLGRMHLDAGRVEDAIAVATRQLALDPLQEPVHRRLMRCYTAQGRFDAALKQFSVLGDVLEAELGLQPEPASANLALEIRERRRGQVPTAPARAPPAPPSPQVPLRPSIAVLPFRVLSDDRSAAFFGEGVADDIIIELSRGAELMVSARQSSFRFDPATPAREVGGTLGVRFCLTGSVRMAGDRVRVSAHLIRCEDEAEVWAERYDRGHEDFFEIQTEIARTVTGTVVGRIAQVEAASTRNKPGDLATYDLVLRGVDQMFAYTEGGLIEAEKWFEKAIAAEPDYARPHSLLALARIYRRWYYNLDVRVSDLSPVAERAIALDPSDTKGHLALGIVRLLERDHTRSGHHFEAALARNRNDDLLLVEYGRYLMYVDRSEEGIRRIREAMRLNPFHPNWYWNIYGRCLHTIGRYDEAVEKFERILNPPFWVHVYLASCHAMLGNTAAAERHRDLLFQAFPDFSLAGFETVLPYNRPETAERFLATLKEAGLT